MPERKLIEGFERFRQKYYGGEGLMKKLVSEGATPEFFIINCIDPRNGADLVFDAKPGQQFVQAQMAALIPPYNNGQQLGINAALRFAIDFKGIKYLIIMGHSHCGGCQALIEDTDEKGYIAAWVAPAREALARAKERVGENDAAVLARETERQVVALSLRNILEYPTVHRALEKNELTIHAWFFDMENGTLHEYDPNTDNFVRLHTMAQEEWNKTGAPGHSCEPDAKSDIFKNAG